MTVGTDTVLITGAASGIGRRLALDFAATGTRHLILLDRDTSGLESLRGELLGPAGLEVTSLTCDVSSAAEVAEAVRALGDPPPPIDILVNSAGVVYTGAFENMSMEDFERVVQVDLLGSVRVTKAFLPQIRNSIVNIASLAGLVGAPGACAYSAAKFGLVGFSQALATELRGRVHVCAVCPSLVKTDIAQNVMLKAADDRATKDVMSGILDRIGSPPERVSRAVMTAIRKKRELVLVNADAHFLYYLNRLMPGASRLLTAALYRRLRKKGVIAE